MSSAGFRSADELSGSSAGEGVEVADAPPHAAMTNTAYKRPSDTISNLPLVMTYLRIVVAISLLLSNLVIALLLT